MNNRSLLAEYLNEKTKTEELDNVIEVTLNSDDSPHSNTDN